MIIAIGLSWGSVKAEEAPLSAKDKSAIFVMAEDTLTCATAVRQSFPPYESIIGEDADGNTVKIKLHAVAYGIFLTAVKMYQEYNPVFTKEDVDSLWADKNTMFISLPQEFKDDILEACGEMLSPASVGGVK